jgi:hypothetical protein
MRTDFMNFFDALNLGQPIDCGRLTLVPIFSEYRSGLNYHTLDRAVEQGLIHVTEVVGQATVPRMAVRNDSELPVFVPDGTILVGCKQNRVVNISLLLPPRGTTNVPVSCVERGRWHPVTKESSPALHCDPALRRKMLAQTMGYAKSQSPIYMDQKTVWDHVDVVLGQTGATNATADYCAAFTTPQHAGIEVSPMKPPPEAVGIAVLAAGCVHSIDIFDRPSTLEDCCEKLARGVVLSAKRDQPESLLPVDVKAFVADALRSKRGEFCPVGLGVHHRFENENAVGNALVHHGQITHLALFSKEVRSSGARPFAVERGSHSKRRPRPWWRLW